MRILISTPLFPPEVAYPAVFSKNFAKHLASCGYDVIVATFSDFPESLEGVQIVHVKKSHHILVRLVKFYLQMLKFVPRVDLVILKQAGFSSFLTLLVAKIFRKKIILKLKEDEAHVRIINQKVDEASFTIWRVKRLQQYIFKNVDFILFENEILKNKIIQEYNLGGVNIGVLAHPKDHEIISYGDAEHGEKELTLKKHTWENYTNNFLEYTKTHK